LTRCCLKGRIYSAEYRSCNEIRSGRASRNIGNGATAIRSPAKSARPRSNSPRRKRRGFPRRRGSKAQCHRSKWTWANFPKRVLRSTRSLRRSGRTTTLRLKHSLPGIDGRTQPTSGRSTGIRGIDRLQAETYREPMKFTVVPPVRAGASALSRSTEKLRPITHSDLPSRSATMDIPLSETVIRLDFISTDFEETIPATLP